MKKSKLLSQATHKRLKIFLSLAITTLALWLSLRNLNWQAAKDSFSQVNYFWVILALANTMIIVYALGWRWQILLYPKEKVPLSELFRLNIISQYINIIIPGRFGEISKAYLTTKRYQISGGYVMGTIVIEKILDFFVFVILWIAIPAFFAMEKELKGYKTVLFFCLLTVPLLVFFIWHPKTVLKWISYFSRIVPRKFRKGFQEFFEKGIEAFRLLKNAKKLFFIAILTLGFILGQVLTNYFLFKAFHMNLSFWVGLFLLLAIQVGNIPPSVPGKIGIFEYAVILALSIFNISKGQALSYGIMLHLVAFVPKILLGFIFLSKADLSLRKARQKKFNS